MQTRSSNEGILKVHQNKGTKETALTETELEDKDHHGVTYKEQKKKRQNMGKSFSYWRPVEKDEF